MPCACVYRKETLPAAYKVVLSRYCSSRGIRANALGISGVVQQGSAHVHSPEHSLQAAGSFYGSFFHNDATGPWGAPLPLSAMRPGHVPVPAFI